MGGGKAHGPQPRSYAYRPTRKMRLGALKSALSLKLRDGRACGGDTRQRELQSGQGIFELRVSGDVMVTATDGFELTTGEASFDQNTGIARAPGPVAFRKGIDTGGEKDAWHPGRYRPITAALRHRGTPRGLR